MLFLYNILIFMGIIFAFPLIVVAVLTTDKWRKTFLRRLGVSHLPKYTSQNRFSPKNKRPIWVHALSVGEVISAVPLIRGLKNRFGGQNIVFSASTKTGYEVADQLLKDLVGAVFFFPYDLIFSVKRITGKIDPAIAIIVESDIWPNYLFEMKKRNIPVVLVNARLSRRSFVGYRRFSFIAKTLFLMLSQICAQSAKDECRFRRLGVPADRIRITGNLKFDQEFDPVQEGKIYHLRRSMNIQRHQKIFLAGSTHPGEETILSDAYCKIKKEFPDLVLIIAPRDPERSESVCKVFQSAGFAAYPLKDFDNSDMEKGADVIVVDTIGILRQLYALSDLAFVGGSLVNRGGHNPLEPAAYCKPILFGPDMSNFSQISEMLMESRGALSVEDAAGLYRNAVMILADAVKAQAMGRSAYRIFQTNKGAVGKTLKVIENLVEQDKGQ